MNSNRRTIVRGALSAMAIGTMVRATSMAHDSHGATPDADEHHHSGHHGSGSSAAYMVITNNGGESDVLTGGSTDAADILEIHTMEMDGDIMRMEEMEDGLEIPAGESVTLESGGYHVMFINLTRDLHEGDEVTLTLEFEEAGDIELTVPVAAEAPEEDRIEHGELVIEGAFVRPAPMLGGAGTPEATPNAH